MAEGTRRTVITFTIDAPGSVVDELKVLLEALGVRFDPLRQVVAFNDAMMAQSVAMGHHLPGMVEGMNRSLDEAGLRPRIPGDHEEWSVERRQAFLQFAIDNFNWDDDTVNDTWWANEGMTWRELTQEHPLVFGEET